MVHAKKTSWNQCSRPIAQTRSTARMVSFSGSKKFHLIHLDSTQRGRGHLALSFLSRAWGNDSNLRGPGGSRKLANTDFRFIQELLGCMSSSTLCTPIFFGLRTMQQCKWMQMVGVDHCVLWTMQRWLLDRAKLLLLDAATHKLTSMPGGRHSPSRHSRHVQGFTASCFPSSRSASPWSPFSPQTCPRRVLLLSTTSRVPWHDSGCPWWPLSKSS